MGSGISLAFWLVMAYFIVKGFLSWLADVAIWALKILDPKSIPKHPANQLCWRCGKIVEEALEAKRKKATKHTEQS